MGIHNAWRAVIWEEYAQEHPHFIGEDVVSELLEKLLRYLNELGKQFSIIDLGCGDGILLYALHSKGLLRNASRVVGVDISEERIRRLRSFRPFAEGIVGDVCDLKQVLDNSFDVAISTQVIEHVPDDSRMLGEIQRILKPGGYFYVSTVVKKRYGVWVYYEGGRGFKLDPTHVREYRSEWEFLDLLERRGFEVIEYRSRGVRYPSMDLLLRLLMKLGLLRISSDFYLKHKVLRKLRRMRIPVVGYKTIEVIARKV